MLEAHVLDSFGLLYGPVVGYCGQARELLDGTRGKKCLYMLSGCYFLRKNVDLFG